MLRRQGRQNRRLAPVDVFGASRSLFEPPPQANGFVDIVVFSGLEGDRNGPIDHRELAEIILSVLAVVICAGKAPLAISSRVKRPATHQRAFRTWALHAVERY